ncbi:MAG: hypothetical protein JSW39_13635 [Desulfobacterales bacterium]|nr:MAG: hypothetical protein JSW39_13635 [Desulfobacterales bacterium]
MTYNFDPDRWYDNELAAIRAAHLAGEMTATEYEEAVQALDRRHEDLWKRLDGSYRIDGGAAQ